MKHLIVLLSVVAFLHGTAEAQDKTAILNRTMKAGTFEASILEMRMPDDATAIMAKFSQAVAAKPDWIQTYVASQRLNPGEPLPYHENMGVTEREYARLIEAKAETKLRPVSNCNLIVTSNADGSLAVTGSGGAAVLNGLTIDSETMTIRYKDLSSTDCSVVIPKRTALVSINGLDWNTEKVTPPSTLTALSLTVGRYTDTTHGFLEFRATKAVGRAASMNHHLYLQWKPKDRRTKR
ncbi:hypothetical protein [Lignipirellula cremea]|uniref:Uncharacterized protein n=1 Tax=Lignipirellula cremea TaxID=2528010 RepID=A0A518DZZ7_9BACT|nr:hypothetical protein [Lignipirellula cremea]QDU97413.1 hypothetical protein Pla8534_52610 [Lignipirellula cremea]